LVEARSSPTPTPTPRAAPRRNHPFSGESFGFSKCERSAALLTRLGILKSGTNPADAPPNFGDVVLEGDWRMKLHQVACPAEFGGREGATGW
jgi:hypothetical protein